MDIIFLILGTLCLILLFIFISMMRNDYTVRQTFSNFPQFKSYPLIGEAWKIIRMTDGGKKYIASTISYIGLYKV